MILDRSDGRHISPLLPAWLIAVLIRVATGSATVATSFAAGLVAPLAEGTTATHAALPVLAVGAGSLFFSHVNDAGFWLVKEYLGMSVRRPSSPGRRWRPSSRWSRSSSSCCRR